MNENNVIITSGSGTHVIHVPLPRPTVAKASPGNVSSQKDKNADMTIVSHVSARNSNDEKIVLHINTNKCGNSYITKAPFVPQNDAKSEENDHTSKKRSYEDLSEVRPIYVDGEFKEDFESSNILLPHDEVKQETFSDTEYIEPVMEMDDDENPEIGANKTQYVCEGCGRGFCYIGWLDRHKLSSKACRNARTIQEVRGQSSNSYTVNDMSGGASIEYTPTSNSKVPLNDRFRPSLSGRLEELLCCPNPDCNFTTYWIQSLNKHVSQTCKFNNQSLSLSQAKSRVSSAPVESPSNHLSCHICSKLCSDVDDHIQHMRTAHNMKHHYKCSECGLTFLTKAQIEEHVEEHNCDKKQTTVSRTAGRGFASKQISAPKQYTPTPTPTVEHNNAKNEVNNQTDHTWNCDCGKTYVSFRSYQIHKSSCEKNDSESDPPPPPVLENQEQQLTELNLIDDNEVLPELPRVKHEHIAAVHTVDSICRNCHKEFATTYGLCQHFSRRADCRDWYCKNLPYELKKVNYVEGSIEISFKKQNQLETAAKRAKYEDIVEGPNQVEQRNEMVMPADKTNNNQPASLSKIRRASLVARTTFQLALSDNSPERNESERVNASGLVKTVKCHRCHKIFTGKKPRVAYKNHLRGHRSCQPSNSLRHISLHDTDRRQSIHSEHTFSLSDRNERSHNDLQYYCKLCPKIEVKNRVSLGCHLTIYHGLPQVNVTTSQGDAYRCQTCHQFFVSKYFYNLHRYDCDLSSPYVGIITNKNGQSTDNRTNNSKVSPFQRRFQKEMISQRSKIQDVRGLQEEGQYSCEDCGRTGFLGANAVKMHQKYQCVKRIQFNRFSNSVSKRYAVPNNLRSIGLIKNLTNKQQALNPSEGRVYTSELAKLNDMAKLEPELTICDACGRGPYNSYYYFLEHKRTFCKALKGKNLNDSNDPILFNSLTAPRVSMKSVNSKVVASRKSLLSDDELIEDNRLEICLISAPPKAKKSMPSAGPPSVNNHTSHPSSPFNTNENADDIMNYENENYKCGICFNDFDDGITFVHHRLKHITQDLLRDEPLEPFDCEICGAKISHYQRIQQHLILHLQDIQLVKKKNLVLVKYKPIQAEESDDETDDHVLHCPYCKAEYKSRVELANHIKNTCPFRYQCSNCNRTYSTKESYLEHKEQCSKYISTRAAYQRTSFKCRNCGINFKRKQQLLWHQHACAKIYRSDHSGYTEDVIQRSLTCGICGLLTETYDMKINHEMKCLENYLGQNGCSSSMITLMTGKDKFDIPLINADNYENKNISNDSQSLEISSELINQLKNEFGIQKEVKVILKPFDDDLVKQVKANLYLSDRDESKQFGYLKESFTRLIHRLIKDDQFLEEISKGTTADMLLSRLLTLLGEEPQQSNGIGELNCFRLNLQTFLKLSIKDETLILAYRNAESVDEAITNILKLECEL